MNSNRTTVLVIGDDNERYSYDSVKNWFASSSYNACEANDLFDALDTVLDFTSSSGPDIVLVRMKAGPQLDTITQAVHSDCDFYEVPVAVLSDGIYVDEKRSYNFGSLKRLKGSLDSKPARRSRAASAVK